MEIVKKGIYKSKEKVKRGIKIQNVIHRPRLIILDVNKLICYRLRLINLSEEIKSWAKSIGQKVIIQNDKYVIYLRPYIEEFLTFCFNYAEVGFFSSAYYKNINLIIKIILNNYVKLGLYSKVKFIWGRYHTHPDQDGGNLNTIKLLSDVFKSSSINPPSVRNLTWDNRLYSFKNTIICDDSHNKVRFNPKNNILIIKSYNFDKIILMKKCGHTVDRLMKDFFNDETLKDISEIIRLKFLNLNK